MLNFKHVNRLLKIMKNADVPHLEVGFQNLAWGGGGGGGGGGTPKISVGDVQQMS